MSSSRDTAKTSPASRRKFLKNSAVLAGSAAAAAGLALARSVHAAGQDTLEVGLIGCGGRGTGAAVNAMNAGKDIKLTAMADIFEGRLKGSRERLKKIKGDQVVVDEDHCFVGFGAIGEIVAIQESYAVGPYHVFHRKPEWSEMEWQMRNWYHFNWLAGDQVIQQLMHFIDRTAWALGDEPPLKAWGVGGRSACFGESYGDLFDHQAIVYEYAGGVRVYGICRNQLGCHPDTTGTIFGTKGTAYMSGHGVSAGRIEGQTNWQCKRSKVSMMDVEHQELFDSATAKRSTTASTWPGALCRRCWGSSSVIPVRN